MERDEVLRERKFYCEECGCEVIEEEDGDVCECEENYE